MNADEKLELQNKMVNLFHTSDNRAAAIVVTSYLEEQLKLAILGHFKNFSTLNKDDRKNLTGGNGPLSTFSSRISMAYLLDLINKDQYDDLNLIRKIRNGFAHQLDAVTFDFPEIKSRCSHLKLIKPEDAETAQNKFFWTVVNLAMHLNGFKKWEPKEMED